MGRSAPSASPSKPHTHRCGAFLLGETWVGGSVLAFSLLHRAGGRHKLVTGLTRAPARGPVRASVSHRWLQNNRLWVLPLFFEGAFAEDQKCCKIERTFVFICTHARQI